MAPLRSSRPLQFLHSACHDLDCPQHMLCYRCTPRASHWRHLRQMRRGHRTRCASCEHLYREQTQSPNCPSCRAGLHRCGSSPMWLHPLLELAFGCADLKIWNAPLGGVAHSLAIADFAQSLNLLIGHARIDDHCPILLRAVGLSERLALVSEVVVQDWHSCDKLRPIGLAPIDPGALSTDCGQTQCCSKACWHGAQEYKTSVGCQE